ncbi:Mitochondrial acidic protein mam33 [Coemansia sp. RSA 1935]|nr:Mitochondrial acidic protein mam33 [Coemansia sp. RSA 1591]KAJ1767359.1 Mitochondrial acidic protein mam33 [Coemansia sp. RSA 1752]KAJ2527746.1 Mitochondrial acidic protein mam33 [Coemansia sp. RSA 1935]
MKYIARNLVTAAARNAAPRFSQAASIGLGARMCARVIQPVGTIRTLTTTMPMRVNGSSDSDLLHTLRDEADYEAKQAAEEGEPEFIQAFMNKTGFKIKTKTGEQKVTMTKQFGSETITISFDVGEILNAENPIADFETYRENDSGDVQKEAEINADDTPEDFAIGFTATISKNSTDMLFLELESNEGEVGVNHMRFLSNKDVSDISGMDLEWVRQKAYCGPLFGQLSDDLKENIDAFLAERNIDTGLTLFMQDYIEHKEQSEYLNWLRKFKSFVEA